MNIRIPFTYENHQKILNELETLYPRKPMITTQTNEMPAFKITLSNGTNYVTSMAYGITLDNAREYFLNTYQVTEDYETGQETYLTRIKVEEA